ncbi:MAG: hypothetical protein ACOH2M_11175, partial [Cypionkella sp.]
AKADRAALPKEPVEAVPMGSYLTEAQPLAPNQTVEFYPNHTMKLPADPRIFAPHILPLIQQGKFERGLARKLPQALDRGAQVLEIGSAVGFLAGHAANERTDTTWTLQEDSTALRTTLQIVCAISNRSFNDRFRLSDQRLGDDPRAALASLLHGHNPTALLVADARITPEMLADPSLNPPAQIFLYGRWLEAHHAINSTLQGYAAQDGFDPNILRVYRAIPE